MGQPTIRPCRKVESLIIGNCSHPYFGTFQTIIIISIFELRKNSDL